MTPALILCRIGKLGWRKLDVQRKFHKAVMFYKLVNGLQPNYLCSKFSERSSLYSLRDAETELPVPLPRIVLVTVVQLFRTVCLLNSVKPNLSHLFAQGTRNFSYNFRVMVHTAFMKIRSILSIFIL